MGVTILAITLIPPCSARAANDPIKAFCIDFNWGEGGPNGFAKPGLWADAIAGGTCRVVCRARLQRHPDVCRLLQRLRLVQGRHGAAAARAASMISSPTS